MILRFNVSNYLSFNQLTEFNSLTGEYRRFDNHVFKFKDLDLLKLSVIYGANASGKSNLVMALDYLRKAIINEDLSDLELSAFRGNENNPSNFEIEFIANNNIYIYGFEVLKDKVKKEYLFFSGMGKKDILIFDRVVNNKGKSKIDVHKKYLKLKKFRILKEHYESKAIANQLFLNLIGDVDLGKISNEIENVIRWVFQLNVIFPKSKPTYLTANLISDPSFMKFTKDMLCSFDTGIKDLHIKKFGFKDYFGEDDKDTINELIDDLKNGDEDVIPLSVDMIATLEDEIPIIKKLYIEHVGFGVDDLFSFFEESDGTKRLIEFMSMLYYLVVKNIGDTVYVIDEIGRSIHPYLLKTFLSKLSKEKNINGQLIFTTHQADLLDLNILRPDEIWFTEKNREKGNTEFITLAEFKKIRPDLNIRRGYLNGRFGGIPILDNFEDLNWNKYASS